MKRLTSIGFLLLIGALTQVNPSASMEVKATAEGDGIVLCCDSGEGRALYMLKWEYSGTEAVRLDTPFVHKRYRRLACGGGGERVFDQSPPGGSIQATLSMSNASTLTQTEYLNCPFGTIGYSYIDVPQLGALKRETDEDSTFCIQPCSVCGLGRLE